jgi:Zn-dependent protease with chaperone function
VVTYCVALLLCLFGADLVELKSELSIIFLFAAAVSALLMVVVSVNRMIQLRAGGRVIAEGLGGVLVPEEAGAGSRRQLLNIVQEMAVASGIPTPAVYVLEHQQGINAFAAGNHFEDAVVAVTQGCLDRLTREQLQGVIAHEFSHILNGDMRLNIKLVGVLHGILGVMLFAQGLIEAGNELLNAPVTHHHQDATLLGPPLILFGALLWPVGLIGTFFASLVKSAASRQREFLADAYAVQFTRNPEAVAGALKVLSGHEAGSRVHGRRALEASHFFFAQGCGRLGSLLDTHPPLTERIRRLDPQWDGVPLFPDSAGLDTSSSPYGESLCLVASPGSQPDDTRSGEAAEGAADACDEATTVEGASSSQEWMQRQKRQLLEGVPAGLLDLFSDSQAVPVVTYALWFSFMDGDDQPVAELTGAYEEAVRALQPIVDQLDIAQRTLLLDLILDQLTQLPETDRQPLAKSLGQAMRRLAGRRTTGAPIKESDEASRVELLGRVEQGLQEDSGSRDLLVWAWQQQIERRLLAGRSAPKVRFGRLEQVQAACELLLSTLCHAGSDSEAVATYAFQRAVVHLKLEDPQLWDREDINLQKLSEALQLLAEVSPAARQQLMLACGCCVGADQTISTEEAFLVRGIWAVLGFPPPALLPSQPVNCER